MAKRVAKFEKVSYEQFKKDFIDTFRDMSEGILIDVYNNIKLPRRATMGSAGYDFFSPISFALAPNQTTKIPTGIRCGMNPDWVLKIYPRSSLGFKYRFCFDNNVPIIDSDYYFSDNEGHIMLKVTNDTKEDKTIVITAGDKFAQGIFVEYGIVDDDDVITKRNGGIGSTGQ